MEDGGSRGERVCWEWKMGDPGAEGRVGNGKWGIWSEWAGWEWKMGHPGAEGRVGDGNREILEGFGQQLELWAARSKIHKIG